MNRRHLILIPCAAGILAFTAWLLVPSEPSYGGHPLSYWLDVIDRAHHRQRWTAIEQQEVDTALSAVNHIGKRAIPQLLHTLGASDSNWQFRVRKFAATHLNFKINYASADDQNYSAWHGFVAIGSNAVPALPEILAIYQRNVSPMSHKCSAYVLANLGPAASPAIPALLQTVTNTMSNTISVLEARDDAITALGQIHSQPQLVIPVLTNLLTGTLGPAEAAQALGSYGPDAKSAIPLLLDLTADTNKWFRLSAIEAIRKIDPAEAARHQAQFEDIINSIRSSPTYPNL